MKSLAVNVVILFIASSIFAADATERVLVPIRIVEPVAGAHGSLWSANLLARTRDTVVTMHHIGVDCGGISLCPNVGTLQPGATATIFPTGGTDRPAAVILVDPSPGADLVFSLRVQDLSRQSQTWGTEIPVVREHDLRTSRIVLLDVPVTTGFRNTLRVYDADGRENANVLIRVLGLVPNRVSVGASPQVAQFLGEKLYTLRPPLPGEKDKSPGYLEIGDLGQIAPLGTFERVIVEVEPMTIGLRQWAFVSVTNNETQHVTTVTPN